MQSVNNSVCKIHSRASNRGQNDGACSVFPEDLALTPLSRNPIRLDNATVDWVMSRPVPEAASRPVANFPNSSIIIVTYNNLLFTRMCLESVLNNTRGEYEVVLVDNC